MTETGWHHADIVAAIKKRGTNMRALSLDAGFAASTLQASLYRVHPAAHMVIATFLDCKRHDIWPAWYDDNDRRKQPRAATREAILGAWLHRQQTRRAA